MKTKLFSVMAGLMMAVCANAAVVSYNSAEATSCQSAVADVQPSGEKHQLRYEYKLDERGRVLNRVSYIYNKVSDKWLPFAAYSVFYGTEETVLTYAEYDHFHHTFTINAQQARYAAVDYPELIKAPASHR